MNDRSLAQVDNENILLKTYGTLTYAYCKRRNIFIYIGAFDDAREAEIRAKKAYLNTHYTVDGQDAQDELEKNFTAKASNKYTWCSAVDHQILGTR